MITLVSVLTVLLLQTIPPTPLVPPDGHTYQGGRAPSAIYNRSQDGMTAYFTGKAQDDYRAARIAALQEIPIEVRIAEALGVDAVPLGDQVSHVIESTIDPRVQRHTITYTTGAIAQFLLATPAGQSSRLMVALHGCTGSPDAVLGIAQRDYTNNMGQLALDAGWIVLAPYMMSYCNFLDDYNALGDITSNTDTMAYEMMKIHRQVEYASTVNEIDYRAFYGISYGGQVAIYSAAYYSYYDFLIVSGNMVRDYVPLHRSVILPIRNRYRTGTALDLRRYMYVDDLLDDFIADGGQRIIIEAGTQDADIAKTLRYMATCGVCELVYFTGRHEAAPWFTLDRLDVIPASRGDNEAVLIPLARR